MKYLAILISSAVIFACRTTPVLKNETRPGAYALGERVALKFSLIGVKDPPDSIRASIIEMKTRYVYDLKLGVADTANGFAYELIWDGRKPDGRWPAGGRYLIYAMTEADGGTYSDTVRIGMAD
jgi:hypothetical protein